MSTASGSDPHLQPEGVQRVTLSLQASGHRHLPEPCVTLIDRELFRFEEIWAAAGHPHAVFKLTPADLQNLTGAPVSDVVEAVAIT